jgi:uncharacterized protein with PhoU and TrkA domain
MTDKSARVQSIEAILIDMKDTSDLMLDLAYSSIFYGSRDLARQVVHLEEEVGGEVNQIHHLILEAVREKELDVDHGQVLGRVANTAEDLANAALEIVDVILRDVELHPVLREAIRTSDSATTKVTLNQVSTFAGKTIGELELETETGMRVLSVKRRKRWNIGVGGRFRLQPDDLLIAVGPEEAIPEFMVLADPTGSQVSDA